MSKAILVVDDEQNFLELLSRILGKHGFVVETAQNGPEALKNVERRSFDVALLDIRMAPMDGIQLLSELKIRIPGIKVIMMTAYPTAETRGQALEKGASVYLNKPVAMQDLISAIETVLPH